MRYAFLLIVASTGIAVADPIQPDDVSTPGAIGSSDTLPANGTVPATPANPRDLPPGSMLSPSQNPNPIGVTPNPQVPNTPLLPQLPGNAYTPFSTTSALSTAQSPQLTSPNLYTTGTRDISQIATNTGLRQAFSDQPSTAGFLAGEQEGGYSYPPIERVRIGPFDLKAALVSNIVYDDNVRANNVNDGSSGDPGSKSDTSYSVTPAILLQYGAHEGQRGYASLVYSPTFERFFHHSDQNIDNYQNVAFNAQYPFQRLTLNFGQTYSETSGVNQDLNARTTQTASATTVGASYDIDDKLGLTVSAQEVITQFSNPSGEQTSGQNVGQGGETTSVNTSLGYKVSEKISFGPSLNFGIDKPDDSPQQTYEQATMGMTYLPTDKINLFAQAGVELRQEDAGNDQGTQVPSQDTVDPIFSLGVGYHPFDSTSFTLNASQSVHSSDAFSQQTVVDTDVSFSVTQRFFQRLYLNGSINYTHSENSGSNNDATVVSTDNGAFITGNQDNLSYRTSLSIAPTAWSSASLYYQYLDNKSDVEGGSYHDNQVGLSLSVQF